MFATVSWNLVQTIYNWIQWCGYVQNTNRCILLEMGPKNYLQQFSKPSRNFGTDFYRSKTLL